MNLITRGRPYWPVAWPVNGEIRFSISQAPSDLLWRIEEMYWIGGPIVEINTRAFKLLGVAGSVRIGQWVALLGHSVLVMDIDISAQVYLCSRADGWAWLRFYVWRLNRRLWSSYDWIVHTAARRGWCVDRGEAVPYTWRALKPIHGLLRRFPRL
jgi:hypothetical protein